jgi:quinol monooxygenase YgiN
MFQWLTPNRLNFLVNSAAAGSAALFPSYMLAGADNATAKESIQTASTNVAETASSHGEIISSIHFTFAAEDADKAESMLRELRDASRKEPGVIRFEVARGVEKTNVFALWEAYNDKAAYDAHVATQHFKRLVINGIRPLAQERSGVIVAPI